MTVRWHPQARAEAEAVSAFYRGKRPGLASRFLASLEEAVRRAETYPGIYPQLAPGIRTCRLRTFPYALVFRGEENIQIIAIMHLKRRPGYWKERA